MPDRRKRMTRKQRRLVLIGGGLGVLAIAVALMLNAFRDSIVFFNSPSDVAEKHIGPGTRIRLGGLVKTGSLVRGDNLKVRFEVTDGNHEMAVAYQGVLPDLFREGQGVVAEGALDGSGVFNADTILAKHDETYMPKEVADALKKIGHWKDDYGQRAAMPAGGDRKVIAELGHYALMLALGLALDPGHDADRRRAQQRSGADEHGGAGGAGAVRLRRHGLRRARRLLRHLRFLGAQRLREFELGDAADVSAHQRLGKPRRLHDAVGLHPHVLRRAGRGLRRQSAGRRSRPMRSAVQAWIAAAFHLVHSDYLESVSAHCRRAVRGPRSQSGPAGSRASPFIRRCSISAMSASRSRSPLPSRALLEGRIDAAWARWVRPWVFGAWMCLTLGIAGGSYWAYYELGWGGFWFWDPVENASLMPWLAGTALLHSAVVMEKRGALKVWTILLAIVAFSLSLIGTFLVRSGVLTSVHAFATDPTRGIFILAILVIFIGGALALYAWRAPLLKQGGLFAPISREGALVINNLFLTAACATVFVGTLYPLALEALTGEKISVGPPFFNATFGPLFVPLLLAMPFGPLLGWKRGDLLGAAQRLLAAAMLAAVAVAASYALQRGGPVLAPFGVGLSIFIMAGAFIDIGERTMVLRIPLSAALRRAAGLPRSAWGTAVAHFGIGVTLMGIVAVTAWGSERIAALKSGDTIDIAHYRLTFEGLISRPGPNYRDLVGRFIVRRTNGDLLGIMEPSRRTFPARNMATTEAALMRRGVSQLYLSLGDPNPDGTVPVRLYFKPQVLMVWLGALIMFAGGGLSLSDRRLRIGAPRPAKTRSALQAAE